MENVKFDIQRFATVFFTVAVIAAIASNVIYGRALVMQIFSFVSLAGILVVIKFFTEKKSRHQRLFSIEGISYFEGSDLKVIPWSEMTIEKKEGWMSGIFLEIASTSGNKTRLYINPFTVKSLKKLTQKFGPPEHVIFQFIK